MRKYLFLLFAMVVSVSAMAASRHVVYTADNTTVFPNPERGYTEENSRKVTASRPHVIKDEVSDNWFTSGEMKNMRLMMVLYNLNHFKSSDLPEAVLTGFDEDMQVLRSKGWKCVLRFAYTETQSDDVDATPDWVERHLEQLAPHLTANADVIYVVEAGFVGVWGEWYYTANYGNESQHINDNRRRVVRALIDNVPADRFVLFRYPMTKTEYFGDRTPLSEDEAFSGSMRARMGYHNDAFLHDWGNMGTYASDDLSDDPAVRQYVATETLYTPNGGETNIDDDDDLAEERYAQAPSEMSTYHWSFCGRSYALPVTNRWRSSGLFDTLNIYMGYRLNLVDAFLSDSAAPTGQANITIRLRNVGYAPLYNARPAYIVLRSGNKSVSLPLTADPRRWLPNGELSMINERITIPSDLEEGSYHLYLHLPDAYESVADDPRYAVRLANVDVWDETTGMNDLGADITISNSAPLDPGDLPDVLPEGVETILGEAQRGKARMCMDGGELLIVLPNGTRYTLTGCER